MLLLYLVFVIRLTLYALMQNRHDKQIYYENNFWLELKGKKKDDEVPQAPLSLIHLLKQRHQFSFFVQSPDVPISAGCTQRPHGPHYELSQPTHVQCPVFSLLLDKREVENFLNAGAQAVMAGHQKGKQGLDGVKKVVNIIWIIQYHSEIVTDNDIVIPSVIV